MKTKNDDYVTQLGDALFDLVDGDSSYDLQSATGLPLERCEEIRKIAIDYWERKGKVTK